MLVRVLLAAIFAGVIAGLFSTAVQSYRVIPLILEAERYEGNGAADGHSHGTEKSGQAGDAKSKDQALEEAESWAPADGGERLFYTGLANIAVGVAYALLVTAAVLALNQSLTLRSGVAWGAAGFVVFVLSPNFGLPPELPGMQAGDLQARQIWWFATVILTAIGLGLFAFKQGLVWALLGVALIIAPHLYGAPQPLSHESLVPANLAADFVMATLVSSLLFWLFLGAALGYGFEKAMKQEEASS
jgi:cobalt transporter subunit CbtA